MAINLSLYIGSREAVSYTHLKENLQFCFREFEPYRNACKFSSCSHTCEKGCAVLQAVEDGKIHPSRHASYVAMYNEVKDLKEWEMK